MSLLYVGIMSGTSLDGIDIALSRFTDGQQADCLDALCLPLPAALRQQLLDLCSPSSDELYQAGVAGNAWARLAAEGVNQLLVRQGLSPQQVCAIGSHGQTVRHHPEQGFSLQIGSPALLAELTGIKVIADFRSRDLAAGGEGAPLVPAFHHWLLSSPNLTRTLVNIGGFANLTVLRPGEAAAGFDSGPGNALMDNWALRHIGTPFDADGQWASQGQVHQPLLERMLADPYFARRGPKSTGREYFHEAWLAAHLQQVPGVSAIDVQASLAMLTAQSIADSLQQAASDTAELYICGGGARNSHLMRQLQRLLPHQRVLSTQTLGVNPDWMEAMAFAWLAWRFEQRLAGNLPNVTGARGERILGALYPA
tara:strand:- start:28 stop:1128 length:1101 start_codon:yes stop_codon:yes gene_type:complete